MPCIGQPNQNLEGEGNSGDVILVTRLVVLRAGQRTDEARCKERITSTPRDALTQREMCAYKLHRLFITALRRPWASDAAGENQVLGKEHPGRNCDLGTKNQRLKSWLLMTFQNRLKQSPASDVRDLLEGRGMDARPLKSSLALVLTYFPKWPR